MGEETTLADFAQLARLIEESFAAVEARHEAVLTEAAVPGLLSWHKRHAQAKSLGFVSAQAELFRAAFTEFMTALHAAPSRPTVPDAIDPLVSAAGTLGASARHFLAEVDVSVRDHAGLGYDWCPEVGELQLRSRRLFDQTRAMRQRLAS